MNSTPAPETSAAEPRQRQSAETRREETVEAVIQLAGEHGPDGITTQAIASRIGVTHGALFRHFPDKAAIWRTVFDWLGKWGLIEVNGRGHLKVRAGHVLLKHGDEDLWRHECHHRAEIGTLAQCLNRVGDPQQLQDRMRELANRNAHLGKRNGVSGLSGGQARFPT